jgi:tetratricopeptide (TPR) repeat protein
MAGCSSPEAKPSGAGGPAVTTTLVPANDATSLVLSASKASESGDYAGAITQLTSAIKLKPDMYEAYANRGTAYLHEQDLEHAVADYSKAIELKPNSFEGYYFRATAYDDHGDFAKALPDLNKAIQLNPKLGDIYANRAATYMMLGKYDQAWADVKSCRKLHGTVQPPLISDLEAKSHKKDPGP